LVKALLTKRSLGLLDPKHPTASFAAPPPKTDDEDHPTGAAVYAKFATTQKEQQALTAAAAPQDVPYPEASASQAAVPYPEAAGGSHDWINWKPHDGGMDDETMVKNVLGAVADLTKGKSLRGNSAPVEDDSSSLAAETASLQSEPAFTTTTSPSQTQQIAPAQAIESQAHQENSYLKGLDLTPPATPAVVENSAVEKNPLSSFSWDDKATTTTILYIKQHKSF